MYRILAIAIVLFAISCQQANKKENGEKKPEIVEVKFQIGGMSCTDCELSIVKGVNELKGIEFVKASYTDSVAIVKYDRTKTNETEIVKMIEKRGYKVKAKI